MINYYYVVTVKCETRDEAEEVMSERIGHDEDYGYQYEIDWSYLHKDDWEVLLNDR